MKQTIPNQISYDEENLYIDWKDGHSSTFSLLDLRKKCPCATCRGGHGGKVGSVTGHIETISLVSWKKVGRYAINLTWNDFHDTGIFTYDNLRAYSEGKSEEI
jgi:DUF971 family protein